MSKCEGLRRVLRAAGWKYSEISELETAIELVDPTCQLAEHLASTMIVFAQVVGRQLVKGIKVVPCHDGWLVGGHDATGGPQDDPGDETLPLFGN